MNLIFEMKTILSTRLKIVKKVVSIFKLSLGDYEELSEIRLAKDEAKKTKIRDENGKLLPI